MPSTRENRSRPQPQIPLETVEVLDTTLRDGEQSAGVCFSAHDKREIAASLDELGVDVIEAGFPSSSAEEHAAVCEVAATVRNARVCALARANDREIDQTWAALSAARAPRVHIVLSSSQIHLCHQLRRSPTEVEELTRHCISRARRLAPEVEFSAMDATRSEPEFVARLVRAAVEAGATVVNLPDTVGYARPEQIATLFNGIRTAVPECGESVTLSFHGQNDLGLATANSLAAIAAGARQVEVTVNGIGERAGNTALDEVVMALRLHEAALGVQTRVRPQGLWALSRLVEERSGQPVAPNKAIVGANAFRHASGIHQDGVLKNRTTFELIDPAEIGNPRGTEIVLGKLSGRRGFASRLATLGIELEGSDMETAFTRFKTFAAHRSQVTDRELQRICSPCESWPGPGV